MKFMDGGGFLCYPTKFYRSDKSRSPLGAHLLHLPVLEDRFCRTFRLAEEMFPFFAVDDVGTLVVNEFDVAHALSFLLSNEIPWLE